MACKDCSNAVLEEARQIVRQVGSEPEKVIPLLQEIQKRHSYLPDDLVEAVAEVMEVPAADIYGVATFYSQFRFTPMGKHLIRVCKGTACHVSGADLLTASISDELGVEEGGTTEDMLFSLETVACLGCCSLAPVVMIDDKVYGKLTSSKIRKIVKEYKDGKH